MSRGTQAADVVDDVLDLGFPNFEDFGEVRLRASAPQPAPLLPCGLGEEDPSLRDAVPAELRIQSLALQVEGRRERGRMA